MLITSDYLHVCFRSAISTEFSIHCKDNIKKIVSCVRTYLSPTFQRGHATERGGPFEHIFQTLHLLRSGV